MQSESIASLAGALVLAQSEFPIVGKGEEAKIRSESGASFSYRFASLPDVQAAVLPVLAKHGLAVLQGTTDEDEAGFTVLSTLLHSSGEWITRRVRVPIAAGKNGPTAQAAGSAFAYGRRIGLVGLTGVVTDDTDDDGARASEGHGEEAKPHQRVLPPREKGESKPVKAEGGKVLPNGCTKCGGPIWDNRTDKKNPKAPDWKCRDKTCLDDDGKYVTGGWCEEAKDDEPGGPAFDDVPLPEGPDDGDFDIY